MFIRGNRAAFYPMSIDRRLAELRRTLRVQSEWHDFRVYRPERRTLRKFRRHAARDGPVRPQLARETRRAGLRVIGWGAASNRAAPQTLSKSKSRHRSSARGSAASGLIILCSA